MTDYWYPRDYDKYIESDHYKERLSERRIPVEMASHAVEWGEFFPTNEDGVMGYRSEVDGVAVIVIASGKSQDGDNNVAVTTWGYISDKSEAMDSDIWEPGFVKWTERKNEEYVERVGGDTPAPPEYVERVENE